jgi:hypothetical protein
MTKHIGEMTNEEFDEFIAGAANQGYREEPVLLSPDIYRRVEKAIKEGAIPKHFSCSAEAQLWLMKWEKK